MTDTRYQRQSFLGENAQEIFNQVRVGVVGLGGGGSHIVQQLAHIGFRRLTLFDDDVVEDTNLNRLVGGQTKDARAKRRKIDVAKRLFTGLQPAKELELYPTKWQLNEDALRRCEVVLSCLDSFIARRDLEAVTRRYLIPLIDIGIDLHSNDPEPPSLAGQVILSMPGCPCMQCFGFLSPENLAKEAQRYGAAGSRPQVVWPNGVVASTAVGILVDLLTDWTKSLRAPVYLSYDGNRGTVVENARLKYAPAHCQHYPLAQAGAPVFRLL